MGNTYILSSCVSIADEREAYRTCNLARYVLNAKTQEKKGLANGAWQQEMTSNEERRLVVRIDVVEKR